MGPYIKYLVPTDAIQTVFLAIIGFLCVGTAIWVKISTKKRIDKTTGKKISCWEIRWTNNTPTDKGDDLKVEHGSVQELCEAVATPAEKLASVLPSMLLVVGLMGTFLGVGVALNDAAKVLKGSERPPMEMLQEMVSMLDGLGALFKSSVYGIIGFFAFTLWRNKWGSDEDRFKWCVKRCNDELKSKESFQKQNTDRIISALEKVNESIGDSIADCIQKSLQSALVKGFENVNKNLNDMNSALCSALEKTVVERFKSLEKEMKNQVNATTAVVTTMADLSGTMTEQFKFVASSAQNMGKSATALAKSVDEFKPAVTSTLETIREQFVKSITDGSKVMETAGESIKKAVVEMSNKAKEGQDKLDATLSDFNKRINATLSDIKQTTLAMETQGNKNVQTIKEVNAKIEENLVSISTVNMQIRTTMKKLPKDLSESINETLLDVKKSIEIAVSKSADKVVKTLENVSSAAAKPLPARENVVHNKEISA